MRCIHQKQTAQQPISRRATKFTNARVIANRFVFRDQGGGAATELKALYRKRPNATVAQMGPQKVSVAKDWRIPAAWLTLCVVWSSTWLAIKVGLRDLPPISYVGIRFLVAILVLLALSIGRTRLRPTRPSDYLTLAVSGVLIFALNYATAYWR